MRRIALVLAAPFAACRNEPAPPEPQATTAAAASSVSSAASPPPAPANVPGPSPCPALCQKSAELKCPKLESCAAGCAEMLAQPLCAAELRTALACFLRQPTPSWECGEDGVAAVKDGTCDREQTAYLGCVARGAR